MLAEKSEIQHLLACKSSRVPFLALKKKTGLLVEKLFDLGSDILLTSTYVASPHYVYGHYIDSEQLFLENRQKKEKLIIRTKRLQRLG